MKGFTVIREFGLWHGERWDYRLILLDTHGISPYAIQFGQVGERNGHFTVVDCHRHDASSPVRDAPQAWAYEWVTGIYGAKRMLDYESTMRAYARLQGMAHELLDHGDDMCADERTELLAITGAVVYDLRRYAGFDPVPDFPGLDRMLIDRDRDTTTPDTTGSITPARGGSRMDAPMLGGTA